MDRALLIPMRVEKLCLVLLVLFWGSVAAHSAERRTGIFNVSQMMEVSSDGIPTDTAAWRCKLYIKTNAVGLGMGIANAAAEMDLAKHWSFSLPVYYSGWDYFRSTVKFRTFALQPEVRYWFMPNHSKLYAGIHAGLGWYNMAIGGDWRIQDTEGKSPAVGGGISVGYRIPLSKKNTNWKMEFAIGCGVYAVNYDKFHNRNNGANAETTKKTYMGPDQFSINLIYQLPNNGRNSK